MRAVGIREFKDKLSHYVRLVGTGESDAADAALEELALRGSAVTGAPHDLRLCRPGSRILPEGRRTELLDGERA